MYSKSYDSYKDSKGLYFLIDPTSIAKRTQIIKSWNNTIAKDAVEYIGPTLVPTQVLERSGHLSQFKDEIFQLKNKDLCLRPETAQSLFVNLKTIRRSLKGKTLKIHQIGRAYRNEKSTRDGSLRKCEFEQLELHVIAEPNYDFILEYKERILQFFQLLNLNPEWITVVEKPHYSQLTIDFYVNGVEVGCINYRGSHDLWSFSEKERSNLAVYQISLGLDRLINFTNTLNTL